MTDRRQGGVITNAAVMTMTSGPAETQPITRGSWIAGVVFNDPPDPPPADVPLLAKAEEAHATEDLTVRERFGRSPDTGGLRELPCEDRSPGLRPRELRPHGRLARHVRERAVRWMRAACCSGATGSGTSWNSRTRSWPRRTCSREPLRGHLLEFALGRELAAADEPALDRIVRAAAPGGYRIQDFIRQVVLSDPFLLKYNPNRPGKRPRQAD